MPPERVSAADRSGDGTDAVSQVHKRLRKAIIEGELAAGADVSRVQLAKEFAIGETPLREALRMLQREGFVESRAHRRVRIAGASLPDLEELYCLRIVVEAFAMRMTVPLLSSEDIAQLEGYMAQMQHFARLEDFEGWEEPHRSFHAQLIEQGGPRVRILSSQLSDHAERYRRHYVSGWRAWQAAADDHRTIVDACGAGAVDVAVQTLARHYATTALSVIETAQRDYEPRRLRLVLDTIAS